MRMSREVASDDHLESNGLTGVANGNIRMWRVQFPRGNDVRNRIEEIARYPIEDLTLVWNSFVWFVCSLVVLYFRHLDARKGCSGALSAR